MGLGGPTATAFQSMPVAKNEANLVNIPPRGASDANKRLTNPSPLSQPMDMRPQSPSFKDSVLPAPAPKATEASLPLPNITTTGLPESPAAQQLAALNKKDGKNEGNY